MESLITVVIPSYNQGRYLEETLRSVFEQNLSLEVYVVDGGSNDNSVEIIKKWAPRLAGWRSRPDEGQSAAINEGVAAGSAPFVCWLNSDDYFLPDKLCYLLNALEDNTQSAVAYGRIMNKVESSGRTSPAWVEPFNEKRLAIRNIISQPGTLIRRKAWEAVGGLNRALDMSMDYDLWWRLYKQYGELLFVDELIAVNREHCNTKTQTRRVMHYRAAIGVVKKHYGKVPLKWWLYQPYAVWYKSVLNRLQMRVDNF